MDAAVFPLVNKDGLPELSEEIFSDLFKSGFSVFYDSSGSVGRRYRRQDEVGTRFCLTLDYDSLKNKDLTIREVESMKQIRVKINDLNVILKDLLNGEDLSKFGNFI